MRIKIRRLLVLCVSVMLVSVASADPIDNPGNFTWQTGWGDLHFNAASTITRTLGGASGSLDIDLDSLGDVTFNAFTIQSVVVNGYTVLLQVLPGGSSGTLDAATAAYNTSMSLQLRIKVTGNGLGNNCLTSSFTRSFEGAYQYDTSTGEGELLIYSASGGSSGSGWVAVPALPTTSTTCGSHGTTLNSLLGFDGVNGGLNVVRLRALTAAGPQGS